MSMNRNRTIAVTSLALCMGIVFMIPHMQKVDALLNMHKEEPVQEEEIPEESIPQNENVQEVTAAEEPVPAEEPELKETEEQPAEAVQEETAMPEQQEEIPEEPVLQEVNEPALTDPDTGEELRGMQFIDGDWYYFDEEDGHMVTGLVYHKQIKKTYCYHPETGKRCTGTVLVDGVYYYINEETWEPCSGFIQEFGKTYYVDEETGTKKSGQVFDGRYWYYFDDKTYELSTGFKYIKPERKTVYYNSSGRMVTGERKISGYTYYFDENDGAMQYGFQKYEGKTVYFDEKGHMLFGEQSINRNEYYFDPSTGAMKTGFRSAGGKTYYYSSNGIKQYGWLNLNGYTYYFDETGGAMAVGKKTIGGVSCFFDDNGHQLDFNDTSSYLVVANKKHRLPEGYAPSDLVIPNVAMNYTMYLRSEAAYAIEQMFAAAARSGITLRLGSAYRSEALQNQLYWGYVAQYGQATADTISSRPGYSDHQTGLAADISDHDGATYLTQAMEYTPEGIWLRDHAHEYGFIMRYPKGKDAITGYSYEPWHFRYIGVEYATKIYNTDVWYSFEEYFGVEGGDYN